MYIWFQETFGGLHLKYKVYPDLATFEISGNGYAITALVGKKEIMNKSLDTFIEYFLERAYWTCGC